MGDPFGLDTTNLATCKTPPCVSPSALCLNGTGTWQSAFFIITPTNSPSSALNLEFIQAKFGGYKCQSVGL